MCDVEGGSFCQCTVCRYYSVLSVFGMIANCLNIRVCLGVAMVLLYVCAEKTGHMRCGKC